jgi:glucokinase
MKLRFAVGVDIGGTTIKYGICSSEGELLIHGSADTPAASSREVILNLLKKLILKDLKYASENKIPIEAIGVGTPGSVDIERGFLTGSTPNFTHWRNVPIKDFLFNAFHIPVFADNDANLMAYGEYLFGSGRQKKDVICLTLGTGIGGGIIINGEIYRGSFYCGSELGHTTIDYSGRKCNCGGIGCLEAYASATALVHDYNTVHSGRKVENTMQIFENLENGDSTAREVIEKYIHYLGAGLANFVNIFNPQVIILGGGVSEAGEWFIKKVRLSTRSYAMSTSFQNVEIVSALLGNRAGMLGAAAFALNRLNSSEYGT